MEQLDSKLIFGKNNTDKIVNISYKDDHIHIFRELDDGSLDWEAVPYKPWVIAPTYYPGSKKLEGNLHYKYIKEYDNFEAFLSKSFNFRKLDIFRIWDQAEAFMVRNGYTYFKNMEIKDVSIVSFDIESAGLKYDNNSKVYIITNTYRDKFQTYKKSFFLDDYDNDEKKMIQAWVDWVRFANPSIMCGHNIYGYDWGYLNHRAKENNISLDLGRDESEIEFDKRPSSKRKDGSQEYEYHNVRIFGREVIDTMFLAFNYDAATKKYESYKLKTIVKQEGLEKEGRSFIDASKIKYYYENRKNDPKTWENVKKYAEEDSEDALKLFDLMIPAQFYFARTVSKTISQIVNGATGSQMNNIMIRGYIQDGHSIPKADEVTSFQGAISFGVPGVYKNAFKQDVASLYPSIMRQYKVGSKEKDPKGYFVKLVDYFALERLKNKKLSKETGNKYYKDLEQSQKIGANSLYGFLGAPGLNFNYMKGAEFVTKTGREILSQAIIFATSKPVDYWINVGTYK